jgi:hypothetical protein
MIQAFLGRVVQKVALRAAIVMTPMYVIGDDVHIVDLTDKLPTNGSYRERPMESVDAIIIHHTATNGQGFSQIAEYHLMKGWPGIAYHYGVGYDGAWYMCNKPEKWTNHTQGWNHRGLSIVAVGNFQERDPSPEQVVAINNLVAYLRARYPQIKMVLYHRDTKATLCPGDNLVHALDTLGVHQW